MNLGPCALCLGPFLIGLAKEMASTFGFVACMALRKSDISRPEPGPYKRAVREILLSLKGESQERLTPKLVRIREAWEA